MERREAVRQRVETYVAPMVAGLLALVTLIGLIGPAIKSPSPHDIPVGLVGPAPAVEQISSAFATNAPGVFTFTTYGNEADAVAGIDSRSVDAAAVAAPVAMGLPTWIAGDYGPGFWSGTALVALASAAIGAVVAGMAALLGRPGVALAALVAVLLDLVCSGGPIGSQLLPDAYRWLAPAMPAGQLYSAMRGALYFGGAGVVEPELLLSAW